MIFDALGAGRSCSHALGLVGLCALTFAAGCSRGAESAPKSSAPPPSDDRMHEPGASDADAAPSAPAYVMDSSNEAPQERSESAGAAPAPALEESSASPAKQKSSPPETELNRLTAVRGLFEEALEPERLSCEGARPLRDAICEIAERLCDLSAKPPSSTNSNEECTTARSSCEQAQRKYKERCGK